MGAKDKKSTLDVAKDYLGIAYWAVAVVLLFATVAWYVTQNTYASNSILHLFSVNYVDKSSQYIQLVVLIGVVSTLFCMEGMTLVRKCATISFPFLFLFIIAIFFLIPRPSINWSLANFSLAGVPIVIATNLGVAADIPTFFRHSASKKASMQALAIISVFNLALSVIGIFFAGLITPWQGINVNNPQMYAHDTTRWVLMGFLFLSAINANITNIYSASVAWEVLAPRLARKEWLILGLCLVIVTVLVINVFSLSWLLSFADSGLVSLTLIFIAGYLIDKHLKMGSSNQDRLACAAAWIASFTFTALQSFGLLFKNIDSIYIILISMTAILTTYFSVQYLRRDKRVNL